MFAISHITYQYDKLCDLNKSLFYPMMTDFNFLTSVSGKILLQVRLCYKSFTIEKRFTHSARFAYNIFMTLLHSGKTNLRSFKTLPNVRRGNKTLINLSEVVHIHVQTSVHSVRT